MNNLVTTSKFDISNSIESDESYITIRIDRNTEIVLDQISAKIFANNILKHVKV